MKKISLALFWILAIINTANAAAQVGIGTTAPQAALDVTSTNSGFLPPRVALTTLGGAGSIINPIGGNPATGTIVYHDGSNGITAGYYFWNGGAWANLASTSVSGIEWTTSGNAGNPGKFIGTTDANDFVIQTNNIEAMRVTKPGTGTAGDVIVGNQDPTSLSRLVLLNGHISSTQTKPPSLTTTTTASFVGLPTDTRGTISLQGTAGATEATATLTFAQPYSITPVVVVSIASSLSTNKQDTNNYYVVASPSGFTIHFYTSFNATTPFLFNYIVIE